MRKLIFLLPILVSVFVYSCKDDSSTSPNGNPPQTNDSLLYSFDSLAIYSDVTPHGFVTDCFALDSSSFTKFRFTFNIESNVNVIIPDSIYASASIYIADACVFFAGTHIYFDTVLKDLQLTSLNFDKTITLSNSYSILRFPIYLGFVHYQSGGHKFIRIKNFKLYRVL